MKKILNFALALILLLVSFPIITVNANNTVTDNTVAIIAGSDFQPRKSIESGKTYMEDILSSIQKETGLTSADGFLFCGDYDYSTVENESATQAGINAVKEVMSDFVAEENIILAQGNHDTAKGLSRSGKNDPKSGDYGVFVINEDDYMWFNNDENRIKNTAQNLIDYLNGKLAISYKNPIFIVSHLPLHYTQRTYKDGDGQHANYIFDVLNEAGKKGLNIFFLFGHNHSNGWDDYLGGSMIYLAKGDEIVIAQNSQETEDTKVETLNFTYLNAGYVGYYGNNEDNYLTMTVFLISENEVSVSRYNKYGVQALKKRGSGNNTSSEKKVYPSPQIVNLQETPSDNYFIKNLVEVESSGDGYLRINDIAEIVNGDKYVLTYNNSFVLPKVVVKSNGSGERKGLDLQSALGISGSQFYGSHEDKEWVFVETEGGWLLGRNNKYLALNSTDNYAITATLEDKGDVFTLKGSNVFEFSNGTYVLNYNSRGLINGYANGPAQISIYKKIKDQPIKVVGGIATIDDVATSFVNAGETVCVTAEKAPEGKEFEKWIVEKGNLILSDENSKNITFEMPNEEVYIKAVYKEIENTQITDKKGCSSNVSYNHILSAIFIIAVLAQINLYRHLKNKSKC